MSNDELRKSFAEIAREWVGVRYRHRGITKNGCDCTGMLIGIAKSLGYLAKYKLRMYQRDWNLHSAASDFVIEELEKFGDEIPNSEMQNGDVVVFRLGKCPAHVGIMVDIAKRLFVHSFFAAKEAKYAILRNSGWSKRWIKTYRLNDEKMALYN